MAENLISQIKVGTTTYDIRDAAARAGVDSLGTRMTAAEGEITSIKSEIKGGTHLLGKAMSSISEEIYDGSHYRGPIYIEGTQTGVTAKAGDIILNGAREFIWDGVADSEESPTYYGTWHDIGNEQGLGDLAYKDTASGNVSVSGTVTVPTITTGAPTSGTLAATAASSNVTLSGGSTSKLVTTSIPVHDASITVHDTPTLNTTNVNKVTDVGTLPSMEVSGEVLSFNPGTLPTISENISVGTSLSEGTAKSVVGYDGGGSVTVATGAVAENGAGATVATSLYASATAAAQTITISGAPTTGITVGSETKTVESTGTVTVS